jgi:hypothetical protein
MRDQTLPSPTRKFLVSPLYFPVLEKISGSFKGGFTFWTRFFVAVGGPITEIDIAHSGPDFRDIGDTEKLFSAIGESCLFLQKLRLDNICVPDTTTAAQLARLYDPLLQCRSLAELRLGLDAGPVDLCFVLSNDDFLAMAQAWKPLEYIRIASSETDDRYHASDDLHPTASLTVLEMFISHCPSIYHVTLSLDATNLPPLTLNRRAHLSKLSSINFALSPVIDIRGVVRWLGNLCPPDGIDSWWPVQEQWESVRDEVKYLQSHDNDLRKELDNMTNELDKMRSENEELPAERDSALLQVQILEKRSHVD